MRHLKNALSKISDCSIIKVNLVLSLLIVILYNRVFFGKVFTLIRDNAQDLPLLFTALVPVALCALFVAIWMLLFSYRFVFRPAFVIFALLGSLMLYGQNRYGIVYDKAMFENFLQTHFAEAAAYVSFESTAYFLIYGVLPAVIVCCIRIKPQPVLRTNAKRFLISFACIALTAVHVAVFFQQYSFIGRENKTITRNIIPYTAVVALERIAYEKYLKRSEPFVPVGRDAVLKSTTDKPKLVILVVGETARAQNYRALGYERDTTPFTDPYNPLTFREVSSCGTATAQSLPCMFSVLPRAAFNNVKAEKRDNMLDVLKTAGVNVLWIENDSGCKGVCKNVPTIEVNASAKNPGWNAETNSEDPKKNVCSGGYCFDESMLPIADREIRRFVSEQNRKDTLIVVHLVGSHGPKYHDRYPEDFSFFTPDGKGKSPDSISRQELINSYDNSIRYSDFVISELIEMISAKSVTDVAATGLVYVSDHGESLGENGIYLHGLPYFTAPAEQKTVPLMIHLSAKNTKDDTDAKDASLSAKKGSDLGVDLSCLADFEKANVGSVSHDNLFHSILGLFEVSTKDYSRDLDIFSGCRL